MLDIIIYQYNYIDIIRHILYAYYVLLDISKCGRNKANVENVTN